MAGYVPDRPGSAASVLRISVAVSSPGRSTWSHPFPGIAATGSGGKGSVTTSDTPPGGRGEPCRQDHRVLVGRDAARASRATGSSRRLAARLLAKRPPRHNREGLVACGCCVSRCDGRASPAPRPRWSSPTAAGRPPATCWRAASKGRGRGARDGVASGPTHFRVVVAGPPCGDERDHRFIQSIPHPTWGPTGAAGMDILGDLLVTCSHPPVYC